MIVTPQPILSGSTIALSFDRSLSAFWADFGVTGIKYFERSALDLVTTGTFTVVLVIFSTGFSASFATGSGLMRTD